MEQKRFSDHIVGILIFYALNIIKNKCNDFATLNYVGSLFKLKDRQKILSNVSYFK